jgi:hypothetical protein
VAGAPGALDPGMFVGRHGLGGQLPADPFGLLGQDDFFPQTQGAQGRGNAAEPAADDQNVGFQFASSLNSPWIYPAEGAGQIEPAT